MLTVPSNNFFDISGSFIKQSFAKDYISFSVWQKLKQNKESERWKPELEVILSDLFSESLRNEWKPVTWLLSYSRN